MSMPGFTADASLYTTRQQYRQAGSIDQVGAVVQPAYHCNPTCLSNCVDLCIDPSDCWDLPNPQARASCLRAAAACRAACRHRCCH